MTSLLRLFSGKFGKLIYHKFILVKIPSRAIPSNASFKLNKDICCLHGPFKEHPINSQVRLYFFAASRNQVALHRNAQRWVPRFSFCSRLVSQMQVQCMCSLGGVEMLCTNCFLQGQSFFASLKIPKLSRCHRW